MDPEEIKALITMLKEHTELVIILLKNGDKIGLGPDLEQMLIEALECLFERKKN